MLDYSRDTSEGTYRVQIVRKGEEGPLCDPESELLVGGSARIIHG